ncbi:DUF4238 domain-containing protein [Klebsiella pneumoniae]|uniref:DUF4238 domain-containing protein n=1 Tax=Klebsiella pneumoniae TaxID=573 RepID=UPI003531C638
MSCDNTKRHHYIPQGVLNYFSHKRKIWWHSKKLGMQQKQDLREVAFKKHFYKYPESNKSLEIDFFTEIDSDAPKVIEKIIDSKSLNILKEDDKKKLLKYIASQSLRTPQSFYSIGNFEQTIKEQIHENITIIKENLKTDYLNSIVINTSICEEILKSKLMYLYKANEDEKFIIGDCPVLTFNKNNRKEIDIIYHVFPPVINYDMYFFPISEEFLLIFLNNDLSLIDDMFFYIKTHNDFQFINSNELVFSKDKKTLLSELKKYNDNCYKVIELYNPELIKEQNIVQGDGLVFTSPVLKIVGEARSNLISSYMKSLT